MDNAAVCIYMSGPAVSRNVEHATQAGEVHVNTRTVTQLYITVTLTMLSMSMEKIHPRLGYDHEKTSKELVIAQAKHVIFTDNLAKSSELYREIARIYWDVINQERNRNPSLAIVGTRNNKSCTLVSDLKTEQMRNVQQDEKVLLTAKNECAALGEMLL